MRNKKKNVGGVKYKKNFRMDCIIQKSPVLVAILLEHILYFKKTQEQKKKKKKSNTLNTYLSI